MDAPEFMGADYKLVGRPFKPSKHLPPRSRQVHLGLVNALELVFENVISLEAKEGKLDELQACCAELAVRCSRRATLREIMQLAGNLVFARGQHVR